VARGPAEIAATLGELVWLDLVELGQETVLERIVQAAATCCGSTGGVQGHEQGKVGERQSLQPPPSSPAASRALPPLIVPLARHSRSSSAASGPVPYSRRCRSPWL
jgi:hypothetical protein